MSHAQPCRYREVIQPHSSGWTHCDSCFGGMVVFHWRATYPQLLLCGSCLEVFRDDVRQAEQTIRHRWTRDRLTS